MSETEEIEVEEEEEEEEENNVSPSSEDDPLIVDYANDLKAKLGDNYDQGLDSYPVRQRIEIMKHMVKVVPKKETKSPFPKPKPDVKEKVEKPALKIPGKDWRKYKR